MDIAQAETLQPVLTAAEEGGLVPIERQDESLVLGRDLTAAEGGGGHDFLQAEDAFLYGGIGFVGCCRA